MDAKKIFKNLVNNNTKSSDSDVDLEIHISEKKKLVMKNLKMKIFLKMIRTKQKVKMKIQTNHQHWRSVTTFKSWKGNFHGMYATVLKKLDDEFVIHYFQQKAKWWILKDGDKDCRKGVDLVCVHNRVTISLGADDGFAYPMREKVFGHIIINYVFRVPKITW